MYLTPLEWNSENLAHTGLGEPCLSSRVKLWSLLLVLLVLAQLGVSLLMQRGESLTIASDLIQTCLLVAATLAFVPNAFRSRYPSYRIRLFWMLMTTGMLFRLAYQGMWIYFEVFKRQDVPEPFAGDVVLFLHLVPVMAALAITPHREQDDRDPRLGMLDFAFLLTWWLFLYVYTVIPWQYVHANEHLYSINFNQVYLTEKVVLLVLLIAMAYGTSGAWRHFYAQLLGASALYASSSYVANWAIGHQIYYSGSIYDIPLTISIAWMGLLGVFAPSYPLSESTRRTHSPVGVWITRFGMLAVFSLPWFALRAQLESGSPSSVQKFRVMLSLVTMIFMGILVFWRQSLLGAELANLLDASHRSYENLKTLQGQLIQSEKLASLGRLVGGAAHEINNPLTAMLGYSDLLSTSNLKPEEQAQAERIGAQVRRTKTLVASLLTFAKQAPASLSPIDLNSVLLTAMRLIQPQLEAQGVRTGMDFGASLPPIMGDSNQLLHVCMHLASQTSSRFSADKNPTLKIQTRSENGIATLEFSDGSEAASRPDWTYPSLKQVREPATLSLSACRRIVEEHGGRILCHTADDGHLDFRLELPLAVRTQLSANAASRSAGASSD